MVKVWDAKSNQLLKTLKGSSSFLKSLTLSPDGKKIIFDDCCRAQIWDWASNQHISDIDGIHHNTVLSSDGKLLFGVGSDRATITIKSLDGLNK